jgi:DNA-binding NarL/FixJ family response regulator
LAVIGTAYDLQATDTDWIAAATDAIGPDLGGNRGACGAIRYVDEDGDVKALAAESGAPPGFLEATRFVPELPDLVEFFVAGPELRTRTEDWKGSDPVRDRLDRIYCRFGVADSSNFSVGDRVDRYLMFAGLASGPIEPPTKEQSRRLRRAGIHLATGLRLRDKLRRRPDGALEDAWLAPDGRVLGAEPAAAERATRDELSDAVRRIESVQTDDRRGTEAGAAFERWPALVAGQWSVVQRTESDGRRIYLAMRNLPPVASERSLTRMEGETIGRAVLGWSNAEIAFALGIRESTVGVHVARASKKLGIRDRVELIRLFGTSLFQFDVDVDGDLMMVLREKEALRLPRIGLSPAEGELLGWVMRGLSNQDIAHRRSTSRNTVAKQLSSVFDKCGVSSRWQLVRRVIELQGADGDDHQPAI